MGFRWFFLLTLLLAGSFKGQSQRDSLLQVWEEDPPEVDSSRVQLLNQLARSFYKVDPDTAIFFAQEALDLAEESGYQRGVEESLNLIGIVHYIRSDHHKALRYWKRLLKQKREEGAKLGVANSLNNLGLLYKQVGEYAKGLRAHREALEIRDSLGTRLDVAQSLNNIGILQYEMGDLEQAEENYRKVLDIYREEDVNEDLGGVLNNLGLIHRQKGEYRRAIEFGKKALKADKQAGEKRKIANDLLNLGLAYKEMGELDSAMTHYSKADSVYLDIGSKSGHVAALMNIAGVELDRGNYERSVELSKTAYGMADSISSLIQQKGAAARIVEASRELGDFRTAYEFQKLHEEVSDSLMDEEKSKEIARLEAKYRNKKRKEELKKLEARRKKAELEKQRTLLIFGGMGVILLITLIFFLIRFLEKQKANAILEEQNRSIHKQKEEKEVLLKEVHHRVKNNLQLINSLLSLQGSRIEDANAKAIHLDSQNRIRSMGMLHERIHRVSELDENEFETFVEDLTSRMIETYGLEQEIGLDVDVDARDLDRDTLTPIALILNELISNSLKYAFEGRSKGNIIVELRSEGDKYTLKVCDDGIGFDADRSQSNSDNLGLDIVESLADQLGGELERTDRESGGICFSVTFRNQAPA